MIPHQMSRTGPRWQRTLALGAVVAGLAALGTAGALWWSSAHEPPAYRYVLGEAIAPVELGPLASLSGQGVTVRRATVMAGDSGAPLAELEVAESKSGPVLVNWQARVDEPFLKLLPSAKEVAELAPVLERHLPSEGLLLAWWDNSRALKMLSGVDVAFNENLGVPLFVPAQWRNAQPSAEAIEAEFWKSRPDEGGRADFGRFVHALLSDEKAGVAELQALAGGRAAVLAVHVRDMILLGQLAPDKIGIAFREFPATGDVHGMVRSAHAWLNEHGYTAYTIMHPDDKRVRVIALTDLTSGESLAARLLPFVGNNQGAVAGTTLVYQTGGFWVYELGGDAGGDAPSLVPTSLNRTQ